MPSSNKTGNARYSLDTVDRLFESAFTPRPPGANNSAARNSTRMKTPPLDGFAPIPLSPVAEHSSLDPLWDEVRRSRERALAASPSKVKSIEQALASQKALPPEMRLMRHPSSISFKESSDGQMVTATFDIPGVRKEDMHVSFRAKCLLVTWRKQDINERMEDGILVRESEKIRHTQSIPLPEGTKFEDVRASKDGRRLILTYPNSRCIRVAQRSSRTVVDGATEFHTCLLVDGEEGRNTPE